MDALAAAEPTLAVADQFGAGILLPEVASHAPLLHRCVQDGLYDTMVSALLEAVDRPVRATSVAVPGTNETLSPREIEVLTHVARGRSNREIAEVLFISDVTVKSHLTRILRKLDAKSRTHAVARARELHLL
jgi:DNA-binding NarL/FixJ family response regulator